MWNKQRCCWQHTESCLNPEFPQEQPKNYHAREIWVFLRGHVTGKVMSRSVWKDVANRRTKQLNSFIKSQRHAWMTTTLKTKKMNLFEIYLLFAHTLFWNAYIWHVLDDLIFYGQWTNLQDRSLNGPKHVTNDNLVWFHIFITRVNTNNIVMLETLPNNADWDCFKTQILQEILRSQNLHQEEHCAFLEAIPTSWMCKKQTSVSHSSSESEIISLDAGLSLDGTHALDVWDLIVAVLHGNTHQSNQERRDPSKSPTRKKNHEKIDDLDNVDFDSSNVNSSRKEALLFSLKTTKQWSRWS